VAELFLERGFAFTYATLRAWETTPASGYPVPLPTGQPRAGRRGKASPRWHANETYIKVHGVWCSLYRAIGADGNLVDSMLSERWDMDARVPACGCRSFARSLELVGQRPGKVTTDGHDAFPGAVREMLCEGSVLDRKDASTW